MRKLEYQDNMEVKKIKSYIAIWQDEKTPDFLAIWHFQKLLVRNDNFQIFSLTSLEKYAILIVDRRI